MKHLKSYGLFLEASNIIDPDITMAEDKLVATQKQLSDYKVKKPLIDKAYLTAATDADLKTKIESLIGKTDSQPKEDRNPFLVEYLHVASLKRKIDKAQKDITGDKLKKSEFEAESKIDSGSNKEELAKKVSGLDTNIKTNTQLIASLSKQVQDSEKQLIDKMKKIEKDLGDYVKKISSESGK